jgi:predicted nucleic acid-binding protein
MIVLVDTSVWIRFLADRAPYSAELDRLLDREDVSGHDFVYGELLIGDKGGRAKLLADYAQMYQAPVVDHRDASGSFANDACTAAVSAGLMCTCSRPPSSVV